MERVLLRVEGRNGPSPAHGEGVRLQRRRGRPAVPREVHGGVVASQPGARVVDVVEVLAAKPGPGDGLGAALARQGIRLLLQLRAPA